MNTLLDKVTTYKIQEQEMAHLGQLQSINMAIHVCMQSISLDNPPYFPSSILFWLNKIIQTTSCMCGLFSNSGWYRQEVIFRKPDLFELLVLGILIFKWNENSDIEWNELGK